MKTFNINFKNNDLESAFFTTLKLLITFIIALSVFACSDEDCSYIALDDTDCPNLGLNIGDPCDSNDDGDLDGTINDACECITDFTQISQCPGFIQNGDFEITTGDPNASPDQDIDLATNWKALWQSGSLADLFNDTTTNYNASCFVGPTPLSGVYAGMWVENNTNTTASSTYREGMFNELTTPIYANTGSYNLTFDYANMSLGCGTSNDVKVGVYGVYHPISDPLPPNPTGVGTPSNLDLFGTTNTVYLGEVGISSTTTNTWNTASFTIDTSTLSMPISGINHIMITNSHLPFADFGRMFIAFDEFCLIN